MKSKIRVAFFADMLIPDLDGACRTMFQIINRIPNQRFEFLFITGKSQTNAIDHEVIELPVMTLPMNSTYKMALPIWMKEKVDSRLHTFEPDIIHIATPSLLGKFALNYAQEYGLPTITIYHTHFLSYIDYYFKKIPILIEPVRKWVMDRSRNFYNSCDRVLVPCEVIREELKGYGFSSNHMTIWPRGIDLTLFNQHKRNRAYLQGITGNKRPNVLFASRLVWEKNLETLINIYHERKDAYNFIIAGDGIARAKLLQKMPKAIFMGHLDQHALSRCYASADVFLFPSISETYGNVVAEALASGLPCVIGNGGGSKQFITNGLNGYLCEPFAPQSYVDKLDHLLSKRPNLMAKMSAHARESVAALDWNELIIRYFNTLEEMANSSYLLSA